MKNQPGDNTQRQEHFLDDELIIHNMQSTEASSNEAETKSVGSVLTESFTANNTLLSVLSHSNILTLVKRNWLFIS